MSILRPTANFGKIQSNDLMFSNLSAGMLPYPTDDAEFFICENHRLKEQCPNCVWFPTSGRKNNNVYSGPLKPFAAVEPQS